MTKECQEEGRIFLMTQSTHFYLLGVGHMIKDHSDSTTATSWATLSD